MRMACSQQPRVFAGQIPFESTTQDVQNLFSQYGVIKSCQAITGNDGRSRGCAILQFASWTEAELAVEGENGTTHLGGNKPMVVKFADPPKRSDGPIVGIAPKKLFVGQIPSSTTEEALRSIFDPFGSITEVHLLKKNPTSGCAFVSYSRWASCEAAIAALHGKTHLEGAKMPMVVKFADAKNNNHNGYPSAGQRGYEGGVFGSPGNMSLAGSQKKPYGSSSSVGSMSPAGGFAAFGMPGYPGMSPMGMQGMSSYPMGGMGMMGMGGMSLGSMGGLRPGVVGPMANPALHGAHMGLAGPPKLMGGGNSLMQHNKMGSGVADETSKQWKLFVGQVPFEASEADLWGVFSTIGPILELVVLRTPQGKSKGCAFVTYENRQLAEKAVHQLDGQVCLPDDPKQRVLIVKFASSPSQSSSQLGTPGRPQAPQGSTGSTSESPGPGQCQGQMGQGQAGQSQGQHPSPGGLSGVQGRFEGGASTAAVRKLLTHPGNQQQQMQQHMQQQMQQQMQQHVQQQMQQQGMGMGMAMHLPVPNGGMQNHIGAVGMGAHSMQGMQGY